MRVTIIRDDNAVIVGGERHTVDCTDLPADFHAFQWYGTKGEVEYSLVECDHCGGRSKKGNEFVTDLSPYQKYVDRWNVAKVMADEARATAIAAAEKAQADATGPQG